MLLFSMLVQATALAAQPPDNPIPHSGGAIIMEEDKLPHALDAGWRGKKTCELLEENDRIRAFRCAFKPGEGHEKHFHGAHFGYVLDGGTMQITDKNGTREQKTRSDRSWWSEGGVHEALNVGRKTSRYVIVEPKTARNVPDFQKALDVHIAALIGKRTDAYADTLTKADDLHLIFPDGKSIATTEGVIDFHEDWFEDDAWRFELDLVKIEEGADMAFALFKTRYRDNEESAPRDGWLSLIFRLEQGKWRLIHDQNTRITPSQTEESE